MWVECSKSHQVEYYRFLGVLGRLTISCNLLSVSLSISLPSIQYFLTCGFYHIRFYQINKEMINNYIIIYTEIVKSAQAI